jgi:hypothetical protein
MTQGYHSRVAEDDGVVLVLWLAFTQDDTPVRLQVHGQTHPAQLKPQAVSANVYGASHQIRQDATLHAPEPPCVYHMSHVRLLHGVFMAPA